MAEHEIVADHQVPCPDPFHHYLGNELFRRLFRECLVEFHHEQHIDSDGFDIANFAVHRGQFESGRLRPEESPWVGSKVSASGGAGISFKIPDSALTGDYRVSLRLPGEESSEFGTTSFLVEDFVPNRMRLAMSIGGGTD